MIRPTYPVPVRLNSEQAPRFEKAKDLIKRSNADILMIAVNLILTHKDKALEYVTQNKKESK